MERRVEFARRGIVSVWVGAFASPDEADAYFQEDLDAPDRPLSAFAADFRLGYYLPWKLEMNFQGDRPRPPGELLRDATFAPTFLDQAVALARAQGVEEARGYALLHDYGYRQNPARVDEAGPLRFLGACAYVQYGPKVDLRPFQEAAEACGYPLGAVLVVLKAVAAATREREQGGGHAGAGDVCAALLARYGEGGGEVLRAFRLRTSEDVGRAVYGMVGAGLLRTQEGDSEEDFLGLFALGR
jgi:uncharacterized repeat protein (TIGR04138 family)